MACELGFAQKRIGVCQPYSGLGMQGHRESTWAAASLRWISRQSGITRLYSEREAAAGNEDKEVGKVKSGKTPGLRDNICTLSRGQRGAHGITQGMTHKTAVCFMKGQLAGRVWGKLERAESRHERMGQVQWGRELELQLWCGGDGRLIGEAFRKFWGKVLGRLLADSQSFGSSLWLVVPPAKAGCIHTEPPGTLTSCFRYHVPTPGCGPL